MFVNKNDRGRVRISANSSLTYSAGAYDANVADSERATNAPYLKCAKTVQACRVGSRDRAHPPRKAMPSVISIKTECVEELLKLLTELFPFCTS